MKKCSYCGVQIDDDSLFCTECGKPVPQGNVCPHCGASLNEGDAFCQSCGKKVCELSLEEAKPECNKCAHCGAEVHEGDTFCESCGAMLQANASINHKNEETEIQQYDYSPQMDNSFPNNIKGPIIWILCVLLLVGGAAGGWYLYKKNTSENEQAQWEIIKDSEDLKEIENFLRQYPSGKYINMAQERSKYVQEEITKWNSIAKSSNPNELKGFIAKYKKGYYHDLAVEAYDELLWSEATRKNDLESYKMYLKECPQGKHYQQAKDKADYQEKTSLDESEADSAISVIRQFLYALERGDESRMLECLSSDLKTFMGKTGATKVDAITYMHRLHADDVYSIDITLGEYEVKKTLDSYDEPQYTIHFSYDQRLNREDTSLETFASYKGTALLNSLKRITSLSMTKTAKY